MYNGIGLPTPRGTGTNGFVQKNRSFIPQKKPNALKEPSKQILQANPEILKHQQKREIELKCLQLRTLLENKGTPKEEVDEKVGKLKEEMMEVVERKFSQSELDTHEKSALKEEQNKKMALALGIQPSYEEGAAFNEVYQEQKKEREKEMKKREYLERKRQREERDKDYQERKRREIEYDREKEKERLMIEDRRARYPEESRRERSYERSPSTDRSSILERRGRSTERSQSPRKKRDESPERRSNYE